MAKVFLSHSSLDRALTDAVRAGLGAGHEVFLDHDPHAGIAPGADWERTLYERLQWADAVVCIVTRRHVESRWCFAEVAIAKAQGRVLLPLNAEPGLLHPLLDSVQGLDYAADPPAALQKLAQRLSGVDAAGGLAWDRDRPIYPGLAAFQTEDRAMFFGRERETAQLAADLRARLAQREPRAVLVVGASGSGKSSLVRGGLLPSLMDQGEWWRLRPVVPGRDPLRALALEWAHARKELGLAPDLGGVSDALQRGALHRLADELLLEAPGDRRRLLLVIDQLEELYTRADAAGRDAFLGLLAAAASEPDGPVCVVATLRSESLASLLGSPAAAPLRQRPFVLAPLGAEFLEAAIRGPARKAALALDEELVRRLLLDAGGGEALPLLAFTLARLVEGQAPGARIGLDRYAQVGGVQGALESQAERALQIATEATGSTPDEVLKLLLGFVTLDDDGRPSRRRRLRADLDERAAQAADRFVDARLLTSDAGDEGVLIGVSHEALFRAWPALARTIEAAAADLRLRRSLEREAAEWEHDGRPVSSLWSGTRLARARAQTPDELTPLMREFVAASAQGAQAEARREAALLADRVTSAGLTESDPELALLLLLAAVDAYAPTPEVIQGLRRALMAQRLVGRVGPFERPVQAAAVHDDGRQLAVLDAGTNEEVLPSTRAIRLRPLPPPGALTLSLWDLGAPAPRLRVPIAGRRGAAAAWSRRGALAVGVDERALLIDPASGAVLREFEFSAAVVELEWAAASEVLRVGTERGTSPTLWLVIEGEQPRAPADSAALQRHFGSAPPRLAPPPSYTALVQCPYALRVLNLHGPMVDVWAAEPVDCGQPVDGDACAEPAPGAAAAPAVWALVRPGREQLALDPRRRWRYGGFPAFLRDVASGAEHPWQPTGYALAAGFSGDGRRLAVATHTSLAVFDIATETLVAELGRHHDEEGDHYTAVALDADGRRLASGSIGGGRSKLWNVETGEALEHLGASALGFSPDGSLIAGTLRGHGFVLELAGGRRTVLEGAEGNAFLFAPDGSAVLCADAGSAAEYTLPDGTLAARYAGPFEEAAYSADARCLLTRRDGRLLRWPDRSPDAVVGRARGAVYRTLSDAERRRHGLPAP